MVELLLGRAYISGDHVVPELDGEHQGTRPTFAGMPAIGRTETTLANTQSRNGYGLSSLLAALRNETWAGSLIRSNWESKALVIAGQTVRHELTVTRVRGGRPDGSVVSTWVRLLADDDTVLEQGSCEFAIQAFPGELADDRFQFCTVEWGRQLVAHLENDERFVSAISAYDGTIGIAGGGNEVHFRLYRGTILEVTRRAIHGADFTLAADDHVWTKLILGDRNDFMERAMKGQFRTIGSGYEYLRMTKALVCIVDAARSAATGEGATR